MIYPQQFEQKLEFDKIRRLIGGFCLCPLGQDLVEKMAFQVDFDAIRTQLHEVGEYMRILQVGDFPAQHFYDARPCLKRIRIENAFVDVEELFNLRRSLDTILQIVNYLQAHSSDSLPVSVMPRWAASELGATKDAVTDSEDVLPRSSAAEKETAAAINGGPYLYPLLQQKSAGITTFPHLLKAIDRILDPLGKIRDNASPQLLQIRQELASLESRISRLLSNILRRAQSDGIVQKNITPTVRDGRLVIPISPAMKRQISGIVHDESDTGKTIYVEPTEVVEANNRIHELENEERREIIRILREVSSLIRPEVDTMLDSYDFLAQIDFIQAKARLGEKFKACIPSLKPKPLIDWSMAVHPLLQLSFERKGQQKVVPLDIQLSAPEQRILLISGPNAGGKSVCLKTVGLLQYMLQCGIPVPMAESSVCGIFQSIFIAIGDEQNLEDDLSTYSSHLLNMKTMMRHADDKSLLLIDEFGSGTEPQIGGAMSEAILHRFNQRRNFAVITTHYQNLKHFAEENKGIVNAAMLYDNQAMRPLFQLRIGNPGSSFAIEIARKIGIPEEVIRGAMDIVGADYINSEKYLQDIARDKRYWENKRESIRQQEKKLELILAQHESQIKRLQEEKKAILAQAREEARQLLQASNAQVESTIRQIKEAQAEKERTKEIRQHLADFKQNLDNRADSEADERLRRQMEKVKARQQRREERKNKKAEGASPILSAAPSRASSAQPPASVAPPVLVAGDYVRMKGQDSVGQILKINKKEALVAFGMIQSNVLISSLLPASEPAKQKRADTFVSRQTQDNMRETTLNFRSEINVMGMRADEAVQAVTYFIDDALVASASRLRIVHGTGSGILKTMIRQYLASLSCVSSYRDENPQFGGAGVTLVDLE